VSPYNKAAVSQSGPAPAPAAVTARAAAVPSKLRADKHAAAAAAARTATAMPTTFFSDARYYAEPATRIDPAAYRTAAEQAYGRPSAW